MNHIDHFRSILCLVAVLLFFGAGRADEPKKEPEKKPAERPVTVDLAKVLEMVQKIREAQARMKAADNLRQLKLATQRPADDPKKQPATQPGKPWDNPAWFQQILPYIEQDNLWLRNVVTIGGPAERLGVPLERVGPVVASQLKLPKDQGRVVGEVKHNSAADKAGLKQHDILLEINGKPIPASEDEFSKLLPDGKDKKITVTVLREGHKTEIKDVPVAAKPDGNSSTIFLSPSDPTRAWEWNYLNRITQPAPTPALPRGYEVHSRELVLTTVFREDKRFTARLQEGTLAITVVGTHDGKKTTVEVIKVQEGGSTERYTTMDKVPVEYRDKAARLLQMGEKTGKLGATGK